MCVCVCVSMCVCDDNSVIYGMSALKYIHRNNNIDNSGIIKIIICGISLDNIL